MQAPPPMLPASQQQQQQQQQGQQQTQNQLYHHHSHSHHHGRVSSRSPAGAGRAPSPPSASASSRTHHQPSSKRSDKPHPVSRSAGSGLVARPRLQRSPHSEPSVTRNRSSRPAALNLKKDEPRDSITEDPFFRQYDNPQSARLARDLRSHLYRSALDDDDDSAVNAREPLAAPEQLSATAPFPTVVLAVVGTEGCGKSTFISQALGHGDEGHPHSRQSKLVAIKDSFLAVRMVEYNAEDLSTGPDGQIVWPVDNQALPSDHVDGTVVVYDVTDSDSWNPVEGLLGILNSSSIPTMLVSTHCDAPDSDQVLEPAHLAEKPRRSYPNLIARPASLGSSHTARQGLETLLTSITRHSSFTRRRNESPRPRANTAKSRHASTSPIPSHTRAASEYSISSNKSNFPLNDFSFLAYSVHSKMSPMQSARSSTLAPPPVPPNGNLQPAASLSPSASSRPNTSPKSKVRIDTQTQANLAPANNSARSPRSFYLESPPRRTSAGSDSSADSQPSFPVTHTSNTSPEQTNLTIDELVERLLVPRSGEVDHLFGATLLALYRLFATPSQLLQAIIHHYFAVLNRPVTPPADAGVQERHFTLLNQWITSYPGDFGASQTREQLKRFLHTRAHPKEHGLLIEQCLVSLKLIKEDDDTFWANNDALLTRPSTAHTFLSRPAAEDSVDLQFLPSDASSADISPTSALPAGSRRPSVAKGMQHGSADLDTSLIFRSISTVALTAIGPNGSSSTQAALVNVQGSAARQAALLTPHPTQPLSKVQWRALMAQPDDQIANELTRIDWIMFSSISPRDIVRHVTVPKSEQPAYRSLVNVERAVDHFNHVACWVSNLILLRDKPKHRAQMLEKLMRVARSLRSLNNYNSLGAIIAGIQSSAIHRLNATRDLIPVQLQRDFMKLEILMGTAKGSAAYRLAWENTTGERIPFLPMVRKDLITVYAANKTYVDPSGEREADENASPKINWTKFQIMGEILHSIQSAQAQPYVGFVTNEEVRALLLDSIVVKDDEQLHSLSVQLEPNSFGGAADVIGMSKRRLVGWLNRTA